MTHVTHAVLLALAFGAGASVHRPPTQQPSGAAAVVLRQRDSAVSAVKRARSAAARAADERDSTDRAVDSAAHSTAVHASAAASRAVLVGLTLLAWLGSWIWLSRPPVFRALGAWHGARIVLAWLVAIAWLPVMLWTVRILTLASYAVWGATIILTWKWTAARQRAHG